ncbi:MAG: PAS domain S-box protein [Gammaproteobacteria bacterium]|nr:PAS domain S-box protein [Gammaproteobacteria bacterium]
MNDFMAGRNAFNTLFEHNFDAILLADSCGLILSANPAAEKLFGYTQDDFCKLEQGELVDPEDANLLSDMINKCENEVDIKTNITCTKKDGSHFNATISSRHFSDDNNEIKIVLFVRDISESKRAERKLQDSNNLWNSILDAANESAFVLTSQGEIISINEIGAKRFDRAIDDLIGNNVFDLLPPDVAKLRRKVCDEALTTGYVKKFEDCRDGKTFYHTVYPVPDADGVVNRLVVIVTDITERKQSERNLMESDNLWRSIMAAANESVFVLTAQGEIISINDIGAKRYGKDIDELVGENIFELVQPDVAKLRKNVCDEAIETKEVKRFEDKRGDKFFSHTVFPVLDEKGNANKLVVISADITEYKLTEEKLQQSEQLLRMITDNIPPLIVYLDRALRYRFVNKSYRDFYDGVPREELIGKHVGDFLGESLFAKIKDKLDATLAGNTISFEMPIHERKGKNRYLNVTYVPDVSEKKEVSGIYILMNEITEQKNKEDELRNSKRLLNDTGRMAKIGGWEVDMKTGKLTWTDEVYRIHELESTYEPNVEEAINFYAPQSIPVITEAFEKASASGESFDLEMQLITAKKNCIWVRAIGKGILIGEEVVKVLGTFQDITERKLAEQVIQESQEKLELFMSNAPVALAMFDTDMRYIAVSRRWIEYYKIGKQEIIGRSHFEIFPETRKEWKGIFRRALNGEVIRKEVDKMVRPEGEANWLRWEIRPWFDASDCVGGAVMFTEDITPLMMAENQMRVTARIFDQSGEAIMVAGPDDVIQTVNMAFCDLFGYQAAELIGQPVSILNSGRHSREFYLQMRESLSEQGFWQGEIWDRHKNGDIHPAWLTITQVDDDRGQIAHYVAVYSDITQLKSSQRKVEFLATHDILTQLPNRALFHDRLMHALDQMRRRKSRLALMFIDLDNFKTINDTLGHDIGDTLLQMTADRFRVAVRDIDTVARMGGDEFTAIVSDCTTTTADEVASRIQQSLLNPFDVKGHSLFITASVGVAFYPEDGEDAAGLIKSADTAMYRAKERGRNRVEFFIPDLRDKLIKRTKLENALRKALKEERLRLVFQPKVKLTEGYPMIGAEALMRWHDPELGEVPPDEFIPIAEASGQIVEGDRLGRRLLITQIEKWLALGINVPTIAINVSPRCLREASFAEELIHLLGEHHVSSHLIQVEITEVALLEHSDVVVANLELLAQAGIRVAVDDFGTGYSSLSYLKHLPLSELKIDKSFVDGLGKEKEDEAIAKAVLALTDALDLETVAEGVESAEQLDWLERAGCKYCQGYYFSHPLEESVFTDLMVKGSVIKSV